MHRRRVLALAGAGLTGLAGCSQSDPDAKPSNSTATRTDTPTSSPTMSPTESATKTATFQPAIYYQGCSEIQVQAANYDQVVLYFEDGVQTFERDGDQYAGTGDYAGAVVWEAVVQLGDREASRENPRLGECTATPTRTDEEPTERPTEEPTATETTTETQTESPTSTPPDRPEMEVTESRTWITDEGKHAETYHYEVELRNPYRATYDVRVSSRIHWSESDYETLRAGEARFKPGEEYLFRMTYDCGKDSNECHYGRRPQDVINHVLIQRSQRTDG